MSDDRTEMDHDDDAEARDDYERPTISSLGRFATLTQISYACV